MIEIFILVIIIELLMGWKTKHCMDQLVQITKEEKKYDPNLINIIVIFGLIMIILAIIIPLSFIAVELIMNHPLSTISYYIISLLCILYLFTLYMIVRVLKIKSSDMKPKNENTLKSQNGNVDKLDQISSNPPQTPGGYFL